MKVNIKAKINIQQIVSGVCILVQKLVFKLNLRRFDLLVWKNDIKRKVFMRKFMSFYKDLYEEKRHIIN